MHHCITFQYSALALTNIRRSSSVQQSRSYTLHAANDAASQQTHAYDAAIDWSLQNLRHQYQKSGGILYKQSVLMPEEFSSLTSSLSELNLKMEDESESSFATNRVGCRIDDVGVCDLIAGGSLGRLMNVLCLDEDEVGWVLAPDIPIEVSFIMHSVAPLFYDLTCAIITLTAHFGPSYEYTKRTGQEWNGTSMTYYMTHRKSK